MESFDPHISLAYASGFSDTDLGSEKLTELKKSLEETVVALKLDDAFQFMVLMDTRTKSTTPKEEAVTAWKACPIRLAL